MRPGSRCQKTPLRSGAPGPRVSTSPQYGAIIGRIATGKGIGVKLKTGPVKVMLPLLFTQVWLYGPPKKVRPPGNAGVRSIGAEEPSSLPGSTLTPYPAGPPKVASSGTARAVGTSARR